MKQLFKSSAIIVTLLFAFGTGLLANETDEAERNNIVYQDEVINVFLEYMEDQALLSESNEGIIDSFFEEYYSEKIILLNKDDTWYESNPESAEQRGKDLTRGVLDSIVNSKRSELQAAAQAEEEQRERQQARKKQYWFWFSAVALVVVMLAFILNKRKGKTPKVVTPPSNNNNSEDIVVRRKTTSVLKKQSLEDVIDNENYMKIDCADFYDDSAVRRMYIKNTCIKEIYNMYAEDLRNPDNPKEDGCMVLGRWVYDKEADEYYVSLEHTVLPGDDAVFSEYELSFGAKIKINVMTKLRKLRQETQLQYDLTCWVHSHPGIGVFFSNTDYSLHMLHKHPTHPKFLTAIVVDILTPQQELGIFTFKHDMSVNSKADLKKTYSLEEWYKWAVESSRNAFKPEDHFNTLALANEHIESCNKIYLSNGAIIDMGLLATEHQEDFIGNVYGFAKSKSLGNEYVATAVSSSDTDPQGQQLIGSFIIVSHCSIPSVRKALAHELGSIAFVLVYSTADGLLTTIPVVNNDLCTDQSYYGEQQLEDLKIWTRRKR